MNGRLATWGLIFSVFSGIGQWVSELGRPWHQADALLTTMWLVAHIADRESSRSGWIAAGVLVAIVASGFGGGVIHVAIALLGVAAFVLHGKVPLRRQEFVIAFVAATVMGGLLSL